MAYGIRAFPTDHYDRKKEVIRAFKDLDAMWRWVRSYLDVGQARKVIVYRTEKRRRRWLGKYKVTRVAKIGEFTNAADVPAS